MKGKKINIVSLGCSKNTVDSESLAGKLTNEGFSVEFNSNETAFDFVLINTCGFIDKAKEESINTILEFVNIKNTNKNFKLIVFGCLAQRYKDDLLKEIPEIDKIFGVMNQKDILDYILCSNKNTEQLTELKPLINRQLSTPKHYAYLKISEGCDRRCAFCSIPLIRGKHVSIPIEEIVNQANELIKQGVKEIILIAQDTTYYGMDLYGKRRLYDLLVALCQTDIHWIRLQYAYPNQFPEEVLSLMQKEKKICHYLDMPLQHINDRILCSMKRNITSNEIISLIKRIKDKVDDIAFRTTLIVGYPTETKQEFNELLSFVKQAKFDRMGAFTYSKEEGTEAALLDDNVSEKEKQKRLDILTDIQQEISFDLNQKKIGKTMEVIIDRKENDYYVGRTQYDSPEVDNEVLIKSKHKLNIGEFYNVKITSALEFDLYGEVSL
ncbi:MAG: 30S ribosomal protein S12 methylthiotransferase RimO [Bacteroidales bacterium]|jgi:ribosomal protein S12 methylthiotransferase|nr:30S ribosomal protein S12 methylthiotransferase RimO [Bacteroidales bacterium]